MAKEEPARVSDQTVIPAQVALPEALHVYSQLSLQP